LEALEERLERQRARCGVYQGLDLDVAGLAGEAEQAPEDQRLAPDVGARQVVARIGLGVALGHRLAQRRREWLAAPDLGEQEAERAREAALDLDHLVARLGELAVRIQDR